MSNIRDVYTYSGTFDSELWYIYLYGITPNRYEYEVKGDEDFDFNAFDIERLNKFFSVKPQIRRYSYTVVDNRDKDNVPDRELLLEDLHFDNESYGGSIAAAGDTKVIFIAQNKVVIFYDQNTNYQEIKDLAKAVYDEMPFEEPEEQKSTVGIIKVYKRLTLMWKKHIMMIFFQCMKMLETSLRVMIVESFYFMENLVLVIFIKKFVFLKIIL